MNDRKLLLDSIPSLPQRQDSLTDQLTDLHAVANRLGMYDAADAITQMFRNLDGLRYGCHCDLEEGQEPDACVLVNGVVTGRCIYAKPGMRKEQCQYWRVVGKPG
jgi:hypothetical protein